MRQWWWLRERYVSRWWYSKTESPRHWWRMRKLSVSEWFAHSQISLWYDKVRKCPPTYHIPDLPELTLSALGETGRAELTIPVPKQRSYTGNQPVISSTLANTPCADLGINGVLERLNVTLGTSYSPGSLRPWRKTTLSSILEPYVARNDDFGTVYARLRHFWYDYDVTKIEAALSAAEEEDRQMRRRVLMHDRINTQHELFSRVPPRRVWDLYANRVVPYWVVKKVVNTFQWGSSFASEWGISHAWVDENDRVDAMTLINGYEWPVPMPKDADLDLIRIEMLNHEVHYAWLDVLCLRQKGGKGEHLRLEEWKLDVPTIGSVYHHNAYVGCYLNGLGRPLHLPPDYFESDRCWFRRAWTLQEITDFTIIVGETENDIMYAGVQKVFEERLACLQKTARGANTLELASEMQNRVSSTSLDKVAGLSYLLYADPIPIYNTNKSDADAWEELMGVIHPLRLGELFFYFPEPGNGRKTWRPSWQQVMTNTHITYCSSDVWPEYVELDHLDGDYISGYCIDSAHVSGLDEGLKEGQPRQGEMCFKNTAGLSCTVKILANHAYPIPDGSYAVIGAHTWDGHQTHPPYLWVVGKFRDDGKFEKLSIFRSEDEQMTSSELRLGNEVKMFLC
ncbi:hypothetical protein EDD18DRAFT_66318 [Armillaria luteobubalina]|uniref:Heterokaryon incompatibility domain-containing protein n=1 Tax=Armillaria luteobubalina TaxID=153913 RepID=A0AA39QAE2_9AGAR|nr:hypothetical protein EDD18DRAFT_66318 [Armillaria luteobubalina]